MPEAISELLLAQLSQFVSAHMGLHFPQARWRDLERGIDQAKREFGFDDAEKCARWLCAAPLSRTQIQTLAAYLTIGETYFLRDEAAFDALAGQVLPAILSSRQSGGPLRIWSAGCCTGEEPYSVAMVLRRVAPGVKASILGTDINPRFLAKAQAGVYGEWSLRALAPEARETYFRQTSPGRFELSPDVRQMVRFAYLNLAADVFPSLLSDTNAMDLIFCRNVLMYLAPEQANRVVGNLALALRPGGWLVVNPSEMSGGYSPLLKATPAGKAIFYHRPLDEMPKVSDELPRAAAVAAPHRSGNKPRESREKFDARLALDHANSGKLDEALACCERVLSADKLQAKWHYLKAMILLEGGSAPAALSSLRQAIYVDGNFILAHFMMGRMAMQAGNRGEADRCFTLALGLLDDFPGDAEVPESDGMTAGRLREIISSTREAMEST